MRPPRGRRGHQPAGGEGGGRGSGPASVRSLSVREESPVGTFATLGGACPRVDSPPMQPRLPSPFAIFAITVAGLFGILATARGLVDSDYYWHVTAGRLVAERGV